MKEIKLEGLEEVIYEDTIENGLKVYIWVNSKVNTFKGCLMVGCGAETVSFSVGKKHYHLPFGTAHFLEHCLCNKKESPLLGQFNSIGAYSNASTYPDKTCFEFVGTNHFDENLNLLLDSVELKILDKKLFDLERGPILEEARMRKDSPSRISFYGIQNCVFSVYPNRVTGLGSFEDIKKMEFEHVETLYQSFYHPKNMTLIVTGNVDPDHVMHLVRENQKKKKFPVFKEPKLEKYKEPKKVVCPFQEAYAVVEAPRAYVTVKIPAKNVEVFDPVLSQFIVQLVLSSNFDTTSYFTENLIQKKMIYSIGAWVDKDRDYYTIQVSAQTKYPFEVAQLFIDRLEHLEFDETDIFRKVRATIANLILNYEDPEAVNDRIAYYLSHYGKIICNEKEMLENLTMNQIKKVFQNISMKERNVFLLKSIKEKAKDEEKN